MCEELKVGEIKSFNDTGRLALTIIHQDIDCNTWIRDLRPIAFKYLVTLFETETENLIIIKEREYCNV